ncbi:GNAT superfamily N-acetyltransferase [Bacillus sp. SLBN-46]|uniref:GNAT family N-acetyltransferase n=1 Tax=Bacillus sp. SLBN-46 TaxID=3042283 RepID=UPI002860BAA4|nr:GNAT family N-acetyltransferase [Bacillus sp. SLBN-46]MDR6123466.1 GNAT superfamily N-acetyltransferase [Bacillus sp. SLBN-46]
MNYQTYDQWNDEIWADAGFIYKQAFKEKGAKPEEIIRNMFQKGICFLHVGYMEDQIVAMALTGKLNELDALLIDYLAVHPDFQNRGLGKKMVKYIHEWSLSNFDALIIEVEAEKTPENLKRIHFWQKCGFTLTDYIHRYIWVPEPYKAMYIQTKSRHKEFTGEDLFKHIGKFHKASFHRKR